MTSTASWAAVVALAFGLAACSGKTERGIASEGAPADKPAAGPAQVAPPQVVPSPEVAKQPARHLLMVVELEPATRAARTLTARAVDLPLPRRRGKPPEEAWRVDVLDATGALLYSMPVKDTSEVRGEFPDAQGNLSGVRVKQAKAALTLRLPLLKDASVVRVMSVETPNAETELGQVPYPQVGP
jgi:hypothetical protein